MRMRLVRVVCLALLALLAASPDRAGARAPRTGRSRRPDRKTGRRTAPPQRAGRAAAVAAGRGQRQGNHGRRPQDRLHRDRRHAVAVRPERRADRRGVLHRLYRQGRRRRAPADHLRVQRRPGRGLGLSQSRPRRPAHRRFRPRRPRRRRGEARRQSRHLARLHRSGADRSDRHRLEPHRQARRRQGRSMACAATPSARQGDRALRRQEQPRAPRRNICWAKATAASAPPRSRDALAAATRASSSPASSWCRRCSKPRSCGAAAQYALGAALQFPTLVATELERTKKFTPAALGTRPSASR